MDALDRMDASIDEARLRNLENLTGASVRFFCIAPDVNFPKEDLIPEWWDIKVRLEGMKVGDRMDFPIELRTRRNLGKAMDVLFNVDGRRSEYKFKAIRNKGIAIGIRMERIAAK